MIFWYNKLSSLYKVVVFPKKNFTFCLCWESVKLVIPCLHHEIRSPFVNHVRKVAANSFKQRKSVMDSFKGKWTYSRSLNIFYMYLIFEYLNIVYLLPLIPLYMNRQKINCNRPWRGKMNLNNECHWRKGNLQTPFLLSSRILLSFNTSVEVRAIFIIKITSLLLLRLETLPLVPKLC